MFDSSSSFSGTVYETLIGFIIIFSLVGVRRRNGSRFLILAGILIFGLMYMNLDRLSREADRLWREVDIAEENARLRRRAKIAFYERKIEDMATIIKELKQSATEEVAKGKRELETSRNELERCKERSERSFAEKLAETRESIQGKISEFETQSRR